jgi:hypothetical protein
LTFLKSIPLIYWFAGLALLLPRIPVIGKWFNIINTAIHELGHALMALILEGSVKKIELFNDASGTTTTSTKSKFGSFLVAFIGYPFSSLVSYFVFYLLSVNSIKYDTGFLYGITILFLFMLILWIRNVYGAIWILIFCAINGYLIYINNANYIHIAALLYAVFIAVDAVFSALTVLFFSFKQKDKAGDATLLKKNTGVPAFVWGLLFAGIAGFVFYTIITKYYFVMIAY